MHLMVALPAARCPLPVGALVTTLACDGRSTPSIVTRRSTSGMGGAPDLETDYARPAGFDLARLRQPGQRGPPTGRSVDLPGPRSVPNR